MDTLVCEIESTAQSARVPATAHEGADKLTSQKTWMVLCAASILATLPVWLPSYPPMADLPQHAGQVALLRNIHDVHFRFGHLFHVNWFTPYLLGYLLIYIFTPILGIVSSCKLVISLSLAALPIATALLMEEAGSDCYWALLCIPAMYGFSYYWGFLNFIVATPLGILLLWVVARDLRAGDKKNMAWMPVLLNLLFFCHVLICAFFGLISLCYLFCECKTVRQAIRGSLVFSSVFPLAFFWLWRIRQSSGAHRRNFWDLGWLDTTDPYYGFLASWTHQPHPGWGRISGLVPRLLGVEPSIGYILFVAALISLPFLSGATVTRKPALWAPAIVCAVVLLFAPSSFWGTDFVFQRFTVFVLPFALLLAKRPHSSSTPLLTLATCRFAALLLVGVWLATICFRVEAYDRLANGFSGALARMEPGQRVLYMDFERDTNFTISPPFIHYASWYEAKKAGVVEPSSAFWYVELIRYNPGKLPKARVLSFDWHPDKFSWDAYHGDDYRYFLVSNISDDGRALFANSSCPVHLIYSANIWWLYEQDQACHIEHDLVAEHASDHILKR